MLSSMPMGIAVLRNIDMDDWTIKPKTIEKSRKYYAHFDCRTDMEKTRKLVSDPVWVSQHGFYPFIHYKKDCTKYNRNEGKKNKKRDICYAAHIDRCILQYYCHLMNESYIAILKKLGIEDVPVAYRSDLGLNNIHLAKIAFDFIKENPESYVIIGDFSGFFDNLDHKYLKKQWCKLLNENQLPPDHYNIFKNITKYSQWELDDILAINNLPKTSAGRKKLNSQYTVLTKEQFSNNRSHIHKHVEPFGIPQGSPLSALLANIYMLEADLKIKNIVDQYSGKYMRYSDDFIIVLPVESNIAHSIIDSIFEIIHDVPRLELEHKKTQIYKVQLPYIKNVGEQFLENADKSKGSINFLGFTFDGITITLRPKTVSKYYYRMYRKAHAVAKNPKQKGQDHLYDRYSERGAKPSKNNRGNFFTYVNRADNIFEKEETIKDPVKNHMSKIRKVLKRG